MIDAIQSQDTNEMFSQSMRERIVLKAVEDFDKLSKSEDFGLFFPRGLSAKHPKKKNFLSFKKKRKGET